MPRPITAHKEAQVLGFRSAEEMVNRLQYWGWSQRRIARMAGWGKSKVHTYSGISASPKPCVRELRRMATRIALLSRKPGSGIVRGVRGYSKEFSHWERSQRLGVNYKTAVWK